MIAQSPKLMCHILTLAATGLAVQGADPRHEFPFPSDQVVTELLFTRKVENNLPETGLTGRKRFFRARWQTNNFILLEYESETSLRDNAALIHAAGYVDNTFWTTRNQGPKPRLVLDEGPTTYTVPATGTKIDVKRLKENEILTVLNLGLECARDPGFVASGNTFATLDGHGRFVVEDGLPRSCTYWPHSRDTNAFYRITYGYEGPTPHSHATSIKRELIVRNGATHSILTRSEWEILNVELGRNRLPENQFAPDVEPALKANRVLRRTADGLYWLDRNRSGPKKID